MDTKERTFKIESIDSSSADFDFANKKFGRYKGDGPLQAAKKAFTQICRKMKVEGDLHVSFTTRETTCNGNNKGKVYHYKGERTEDPKPICKNSNSKIIEKNDFVATTIDGKFRKIFKVGEVLDDSLNVIRVFDFSDQPDKDLMKIIENKETATGTEETIKTSDVCKVNLYTIRYNSKTYAIRSP